MFHKTWHTARSELGWWIGQQMVPYPYALTSIRPRGVVEEAATVCSDYRVAIAGYDRTAVGGGESVGEGALAQDERACRYTAARACLIALLSCSMLAASQRVAS